MKKSTFLRKYFNGNISLDDDLTQEELLILRELDRKSNTKLHRIIVGYSSSEFYKKLYSHIGCNEKFELLCKLASPSVDGVSNSQLDVIFDNLIHQISFGAHHEKIHTLVDFITDSSGKIYHVLKCMSIDGTNVYRYCAGNYIGYCEKEMNYFITHYQDINFYYGKYYYLHNHNDDNGMIKQCVFNPTINRLALSPYDIGIRLPFTVYEFSSEGDAKLAQEIYRNKEINNSTIKYERKYDFT